MANNYTFIDAASVVQTAATSVVAGAHEPLVQISSVLFSVPVTTIGSVATNLQSTNASIITFIPTTTTSVYTVLSSITTISIMAVNTARIGGTIFNNAGTIVYTNLGTAATTSIFTVALNPFDYYELPYNYTGVVAGITASTTGGLINVTEIQR